MAIEHEIWLADNTGYRIRLLNDFEMLTWTRVLNDVGQLKIVYDYDTFDQKTWWGLDRRVEVWRGAQDGILRLQRVYFLRYKEPYMRGDRRYIAIGGPDANHLLARRIVAYAAGTAYTDKTDYADDMLKEFVYENLGAGCVVAARDITSLGFTVQADLSAVSSDSKGAAWRPLLLVLQEVANTATQQGERLFFDVVESFDSGQRTIFQFRTYTGQRGMDRTWSQPNAVLLSPEMGTLTDPVLVQDWRDEANLCYGGGQEEGEAREIVGVVDDTRRNASPLNRCETFFDGRIYDLTVSLTAGARARLREKRPHRRFAADLAETEGFRFGQDWGFGDRLTAEFASERMDVDVMAVKGTITSDGKETITAKLDYIDE